MDPERWHSGHGSFGQLTWDGRGAKGGIRDQAGPGDIAEPLGEEQGQGQHILGLQGHLGTPGPAAEPLDAQSPPGTGWDDRQGQGTSLHPHIPNSWSLDGGRLQPLNSCRRELPASEGTFQKVLTGMGGSIPGDGGANEEVKLVQTAQNSPGESGSSGLRSPVPVPGVSQSIPGKWEHHPGEAGWDAAQVKHSLNKLESGKMGFFP